MGTKSYHGRLEIHSEGQETAFFELPPVGIVEIGRAEDVALHLSGAIISRRHARIKLLREGVFLEDTSSHGTWLNDQRIPRGSDHRLQHLSKIQIGTFTLVYYAFEPESSRLPSPERHTRPLQVRPPRSRTSVQGPPPTPLPVVPPLPAPTASEYLKYLPAIHQDNDFLGRFLQIFESLWEPMEARQETINGYFDPLSCPEPFLPWLSSWFGIPYYPSWPEWRRRRFLWVSIKNLWIRGTAEALSHVIEVCTGLIPEIRDDGDFLIHISIHASDGLSIDTSLLELLIQTHKPAHVEYVLEVVS